MNDYIALQADISLEGELCFAITSSAYRFFEKNDISLEDFFFDFTKKKVLHVYREHDNKRGMDSLCIYDDSYTISCVVSDKDNRTLLITGVYFTNLRRQNRALSRGLAINVDYIYVRITIKECDYLFFENGDYADNRFPDDSSGYNIDLIWRAVNVNNSEDVTSKKTEALSAERILNLARNYAELIQEYDAQMVIDTKPVPYHKVESVDYQRIDRIQYCFDCFPDYDNSFGVGKQVIIQDNNERQHSGEIVRREEYPSLCKLFVLFNGKIDKASIPLTGLIRLSSSTVNYDVQIAAINNIQSGNTRARYFGKAIGELKPENYEIVEGKSYYENKEFNTNQIDAITRAINAKDIFCIMGPPGTGKTKVIAELITFFVNRKHFRVLISSQNNTAVDNVINNLKDSKEIDIIRIGSETRIQEEITPFIYENKLSSLRRNIRDAAELSLCQIENIINEVRNCETEIKSLDEKLNKKREKEGCLNKVLEERLFPVYREALDQRRLLINRSSLCENIENKIIKINKKIEDYIKVPIIHFFTDPEHEKDVSSLKEQISTYKAITREIGTIRLRYSLLIRQYRDIYNEIFERQFKDVVSLSDEISAKINAITSRLNNLRSQYTIFSFDEDEAQDTDKIKQIISDRIMYAAYAFRSVLKEWRDEIDGTQNYAFGQVLLETVDLVGATCIGINSQKRFDSLEFDVAIIDEAGQIQLQNALVPMSVAKKTIFVGDYQQIPPSVDNSVLTMCEAHGIDTYLLKESFFEYLYKNLPDSHKIMLDIQYRTPGVIADFLSSWFYENNYHTSESKKTYNIWPDKWFQTPFVIIDTSGETNRFEEKGSKFKNPLEANLICKLLNELLENDVADIKEIGVISAYREQVNLIIQNLSQRSSFAIDQNTLVKNNIVSTLDSFQGQERDVIIYSFTRSSKRKPDERRIGFLCELRRLNVAISRSRKALILVGDFDFLSTCKFQEIDEDGKAIEENSEKQFADFICAMLQYVKKHGDYIQYNDFIEKLICNDRCQVQDTEITTCY